MLATSGPVVARDVVVRVAARIVARAAVRIAAVRVVGKVAVDRAATGMLAVRAGTVAATVAGTAPAGVDRKPGEQAMPADHSITIWHNPSCSKSRDTLTLLLGHGIEPAIVDYRKNPPTAVEIERVLELLGMQPRALMRKGEAAYVDLALDNPKLTRKQLVDAMAKHPILIERPIVFANGKAAIGRPPEAVLAIL